MMTWILILTLTGQFNSGGKAIEQVSGFRSQQTCMAAASAWLKNRPNDGSLASAICVSN